MTDGTGGPRLTALGAGGDTGRQGQVQKTRPGAVTQFGTQQGQEIALGAGLEQVRELAPCSRKARYKTSGTEVALAGAGVSPETLQPALPTSTISGSRARWSAVGAGPGVTEAQSSPHCGLSHPQHTCVDKLRKGGGRGAGGGRKEEEEERRRRKGGGGGGREKGWGRKASKIKECTGR